MRLICTVMTQNSGSSMMPKRLKLTMLNRMRHFSTARPPEEIWTNHPVIVVVVDELRRAREQGVIPVDVDPLYSGIFFLAALYALMITLPGIEPMRGQVLA